jgi:hypothetical protein
VATWLVDYCGVEDVKRILHIDKAESSEDAELAECVTGMSGMLDELLIAEGYPVPSEASHFLKYACANFAAWAYRKVRDPVGSQVLFNDGEMFLFSYLNHQSKAYVGSV